MNSKQRAYLRSLANTFDPVIFIGKDGIDDNLIYDANAVLEARELVKGTVGRNVDADIKSVVNELCEALGAESIQVIGRKFVIYRRSQKENIEHIEF